MARVQEVIEVPADDFIELTNDEVSAFTFQVVEGTIELVRAAAKPVNPTGMRGFRYLTGQGERKLPIADISSAPGNRIFATSRKRPYSKVIVDHE